MSARFTVVIAAAGSLAIAGTLASVPACSSDEAASDAGAYADGAYVDAPTVCEQFTAVGDPCPAVTRTVCFPMCATGGCSCTAMAGGPRWTCTTDFSCVPEAGPLEEAGGTDAGVGSDGSSADADADADASADANADASADANADASADANANASADANADADSDAGD